MVDIRTWGRLSEDEQNEYRNHSNIFIKAVLASGCSDGSDFVETYKVSFDGVHYFLTDGNGPFAGIKSSSSQVIEALLADAGQNYGR